jgi:hypothetical protein
MTAIDATEYLQRQLDEQLKSAASLRDKLWKERNWRLLPAYGFKLLALIGGIAVAAGPSKAVAQVIGIAIAVAVVLDGVFSNHRKLMSVATGQQAIKHLLARIAHEHVLEMAPVLELKREDAAGAVKLLNSLNMRLLKELGDRRQEIENRIDEDDLRALEALSLDEQKKAKL